MPSNLDMSSTILGPLWMRSGAFKDVSENNLTLHEIEKKRPLAFLTPQNPESDVDLLHHRHLDDRQSLEDGEKFRHWW